MNGSRRSFWAAGAWLAAALAVVGCQDGYPIAATRCDRLCEVTKGAQCDDYNPASCVVSCEDRAGGTACYAEFDNLLSCVEENAQEIVCDNSNRLVSKCRAAQARLDACGTMQAQRPAGGVE